MRRRRQLFSFFVVFGCAIGMPQLFAMGADNPNCPPYGKETPPAEYKLIAFKEENGASIKRVHPLVGYPAEYVAMDYNLENGQPYSSLNLYGKSRPHVGIPRWDWFSGLSDGELTKIGGEIYVFRRSPLILRRLDGHALASPPEVAERQFIVPKMGNFSVTDTSRPGRQPTLRFNIKKFERAPSNSNDSDRVLLATRCEYDQLNSPAQSEPNGWWIGWVSVGQFIQTKHWRFKVTKIVFPDPQERVRGWAELRLDAVPPPPWPPAPHLPQTQIPIDGDEQDR